MPDTVTIEEARSAPDIAAAKSLIEIYARALGVDLCFQDIDEELSRFPATYEVVLVAKSGRSVIGCVCLKRLEMRVCEMKRLFVTGSARSSGTGRALCHRLLAEAARRDFVEMKLDTLKRLKPALSLYRSLGFAETQAYAPNPEPDVVYMSKLIYSGSQERNEGNP